MAHETPRRLIVIPTEVEIRCPRCDAAVNLESLGGGWWLSDCCGRPFYLAPEPAAPLDEDDYRHEE